MTVVKMKKTISRPRNKNDKEKQKDISAFFDASVHMEHTARDFAQHIEDFGMDFLDCLIETMLFWRSKSLSE